MSLKEKIKSLETLAAEKVRLSGKSSKLEAENMRLSANNSELQDDFNRLKTDFGSLRTRYDELDAWSKKLADGYGTGIWYMDESDRPVFVESMGQADILGVIQGLNKRFEKQNLPEILLEKVEDGTAYLCTDNDELLTQGMGSFGARGYINAVTYSITSVKDIDCIWLEIKGGGHAAPGKYCR